MKKITTNQYLIGGAIIFVLFILYKNQKPIAEVQKDEPKKDEPKKDEPKVDVPKVDEPKVDAPTKSIDLSGIPKQCLKGFNSNGFNYYIDLKNNKFMKNKIK
jgi:hypothetical protein